MRHKQQVRTETGEALENSTL